MSESGVSSLDNMMRRTNINLILASGVPQLRPQCVVQPHTLVSPGIVLAKVCLKQHRKHHQKEVTRRAVALARGIAAAVAHVGDAAAVLVMVLHQLLAVGLPVVAVVGQM